MKKGIIILPLLALLAGCGAKDETAVVDPTEEIVEEVKEDLSEEISSEKASSETATSQKTSSFGPTISDNVIDINSKNTIDMVFGQYILDFKNVREWTSPYYQKDGYRNIVFQVDLENISYLTSSGDGLKGDPYSCLKIVDQDGYVCEDISSIEVDDYRDLSDYVHPGEKARITFSFYVPEEKQTLTMKYKDQTLFEFEI